MKVSGIVGSLLLRRCGGSGSHDTGYGLALLSVVIHNMWEGASHMLEDGRLCNESESCGNLRKHAPIYLSLCRLAIYTQLKVSQLLQSD